VESARRLLRPLLRTELRAIPPVRKVWTRLGRKAELSFWQNSRPDLIGDGAREWTYTVLFGIERGWYRDKRMLDVGCGPRGSLDWATEAEARVGLDPLADEYREMGVDTAAMDYVKGVAEAMPFDDASFDVVGSFNSLDHVEDVDKVAAEIARVIRPGGMFLLGTDVAHRPRLMEPHTFGWDLTRRFDPWFEVVDERHLKDTGHFDKSLHDGEPREGPGPGVLVAKLERR
jgi:SAM-dependent methyltransferase